MFVALHFSHIVGHRTNKSWTPTSCFKQMSQIGNKRRQRELIV